jgi:hypothetical protein
MVAAFVGPLVAGLVAKDVLEPLFIGHSIARHTGGSLTRFPSAR